MARKKKSIIRYGLLFALLIQCAALHGSSFLDVGGQRYTAAAWTIEDGLPQNSVLCMIQTRDGFIWFGTLTGLVRFDGLELRVFNRWNTPGLTGGRVLCLYQDRSGALWVGSDGGAGRLKNGIWTVYTSRDGLSNDTVRTILQDKDNTFWLGTENGFNRLQGDKITAYTIEHGLSAFAVNALETSPDGTLWIGTLGGGINRMKDGKFLAGPLPDTFGAAEIISLQRHTSGSFRVGTGDGLYLPGKEDMESQRGTPAQKTSIPVFLPGNSIQAVLRDSSGALWAGTDGEGLFHLAAGENNKLIVTPITMEQGFPDDFIHSLLEDREGNLWVGTYTAGLVRLRKAAVGSITVENGLPEDRVHTLLQDHEGFLWVGTGREGLAKIKDGAVIQTFTSADGLTGNEVRSLFLDREKNLWVGTTSGLNRVEIGGARFRVSSYPAAGHVTAIFQDRHGSLWIGTHRGLYRLGYPMPPAAKNPFIKGFLDLPKFFIRENVGSGFQDPGLAGTLIRCIGEDRRGNLLVGTRTGLFLLQDGRFRHLAAGKKLLQEDADSSQENLPGKSPAGFHLDVPAFHEDSRGYLWVGTNGGGLIRFRLKQGKPFSYRIFTTADGLPGNYIFSINEDSGGHLWMSSYTGVFVIRNIPGPGKTGFLTVVSFDEQDGMNSSECVMAGHPSAWKTREGLLYIPTVKGVCRFDPDPDKTFTAAPPPPVKIDKVIADKQPVPGDKIPALSSKTRVMEFYFRALHFSAPKKVRILYKLEGFDPHWQEARPRQKRTAFYVNLPAGDYCFRVIACNNLGVWNLKGARFPFRVNAPFYKRTGFYVLLALLAAMAAAAMRFFYLYAKKKKKRETSAGEVKTGPREKYKTSALLPETVEQVLPGLIRALEKEKLFLDPGLSLKTLSGRLNVHYNHLSRIINERLGKSFNDYVNGFRIEEAKKRLADPGEDKKTVLEIAYDTGFYSKSVFNTAFKKFTGMTPSQFRKTRGKADGLSEN